MDKHRRSIQEQKRMSEAFYESFTELFGKFGVLDHRNTLQDFLAGGPRISVRVAECCERLVTAAEVIELLSEGPGKRLPGGLPYEFYKSIPDLFGNILNGVYSNLQQNGKIHKPVKG